MKYLLSIMICFVVFQFVFNDDTAEALQTARNAKQSELLVKLDRLNAPHGNELVDEWRASFPEPTDQQIGELQLIVSRVEREPNAAEKYTAKYKANQYDAMAFRSPLVDPDFKPGITRF